VFNSLSINLGLYPNCKIGANVVENVRAGVIISLPGSKSNAAIASKHADEPEFTNTPYFLPNSSAILTWDNKVISSCEQSVLLPFGHTWMTPHFWNKSYDKKFQVSHLAGALNKTYGHSLRHELLARKNEIGNMDKVFHHTYGNRNDIEEARVGKVEIFGNSQYGVAIENTSHRGYFTEKILDLLLLKTIPVYWGCSNIEKYFNTKGIIRVENVDDIIYQVNDLNPILYDSMSDVIEENFQTALKYVYYEQRIVDDITKVFKENNII